MNYNLLSLSKCRFILILIVSVITVNTFASDFLVLSGRVKESLGKTDLTSAYVITYDSLGNVSDSIKCDKGAKYYMGEIVKTSLFWIKVPRVDSTYVFDVVCDRYQTKTVTFTVNKIGRREESREIPTIYLQRAPHKLKEVTVTTSKIKFYHKGDTMVYNADAFQLAEGSMLDALIAQLPGVELNDNGQIKVNGRFVESLLLNGKEFFDGDNNLMLENIGAYTVKDIQVYEGESKDSRRHMSIDSRKELTMDVRLKREYNKGLILNAQGGYGTEDRYMGRLFASWFGNHSRLTLVANANNLNDSRQPGKNDTWTPDMMPSGTREYRMASLNFDHDSGDERLREVGYLSFSRMNNDGITGTDRINFLPGGDTYEKTFGDSRARETVARISNYISTRQKDLYISNSLYGQYQLTKNETV